jgi:pimeloyl-ACP methyl ester carboxylesterase
MPTLDVNGVTLHYEDIGQGDPVVLLHGFTGIGADFEHIFPAGGPEGFRSIVVDLRGHGRSTNPIGEFTFRQAGRDIVALLDRLGIDRCKAIGVSAGAKTLLHVATDQPARIEAMVIASATPYFPAPARAAMAQFSTDALTPDAWAMLRRRHVHGDEQIRMLYAQARGFAVSHNDMAFTPPLLATITARTLVVHGDRDPFYPVEMGLELFRGIPNSALWVIPFGDHGSVFGKSAAAFAAASIDFLRGRLAPT